MMNGRPGGKRRVGRKIAASLLMLCAFFARHSVRLTHDCETLNPWHESTETCHRHADAAESFRGKPVDGADDHNHDECRLCNQYDALSVHVHWNAIIQQFRLMFVSAPADPARLEMPTTTIVGAALPRGPPAIA